MIVRPSAAIIRDKKLLLMKYNYGGHYVFGLPGGNPDAGETMAQTLSREINEELGVSITVKSLLLTGEVIFKDKKISTLHCVFQGEIRWGDPALNPEQTSALDLYWAGLDEACSLNLYPNVGKELSRRLEAEEKQLDVYIGRIDQKWF